LKLTFAFSFGRHHALSDAREMRPQMSAFRPNVYVHEAVDMHEVNRLRFVKEENARLDVARRGPRARQEYMARMKQLRGHTLNAAFAMEEMSILSEGRPLVLFVAEGYEPAECKRHIAAGHTACDAREATRLLLARRPDDCLKVTADQLVSYVRGSIVGRNERIARGCLEMAKDVPALFPRLRKLPEVRVFVRLGCAHLDVADMVRAGGAKVETVHAPDPMAFPEEIAVSVSRDPFHKVTREEAERCLYWDIHETLYPSLGTPYREAIAKARARFERIGGGRAFLWICEGAIPPGETDATAVARRIKSEIDRRAG
jgi:hypothetical protein